MSSSGKGRNKKGLKVKLLDREWLIRFTRLQSDKDGWCDDKNKEILIHKGLTDKRELEIALHEMLHSVDWHKDEDSWIVPVAKDMAEVLWRLGYRRDKGESEI